MMKISADSIRMFSPESEFHVVVAEDKQVPEIPSYFKQHLFKLRQRLRERTDGTDRMNNMSYIKLWLPELFKDYDKILHIDCDTLCFKPITPIWNLSPKFIAAHAQTRVSRGRLADCNIPRDGYYHTGGLLVMNVKSLLADNFKDKVLQNIDYIKVEHGWCHEETLMNINYKSKIETIPLEYQVYFSSNKGRLTYNDYEPIRRNVDDTIIHHFDGPNKDHFLKNADSPKNFIKFSEIQKLKTKLPLKDFFEKVKKVWIPNRTGFNRRYGPYMTNHLGKTIVNSLYEADCVVWHGNKIMESTETVEDGQLAIDVIIKRQIPIITTEDSFVYNVFPATAKHKDATAFDKLHMSLTFNNIMHFESQFRPDIVETLNEMDPLTIEQKSRAVSLMNKLIKYDISKYNCQISDFRNSIPYEMRMRKLVLVIDQVYGDQSIIGNSASADTFKEMLMTAMRENPASAIIVKTHPVSKIGARKGFFNGDMIKEAENKFGKKIYLITGEVNPITLIKAVDKVYVVGSGVGLEAILNRKHVVTFGCPFYAGWGLTDDRNPKLPRRRRKLSAIELFYKVYCEWTHWMNPVTGQPMTPEEVIEKIYNRRKVIFKA